jgi:hypothetical protein
MKLKFFYLLGKNILKKYYFFLLFFGIIIILKNKFMQSIIFEMCRILSLAKKLCFKVRPQDK